MKRKYFVRYQEYKYEASSHAEFEHLDEVVAFLTKNASNPEFTFDVIYGERVEFEPAEIVKSYRVKK